MVLPSPFVEVSLGEVHLKRCHAAYASVRLTTPCGLPVTALWECICKSTSPRAAATSNSSTA